MISTKDENHWKTVSANHKVSVETVYMDKVINGVKY